MSHRLSVIKNSIVSSNKNLLQQARQRMSFDAQQLRNLLFQPGNFDHYVKPLIEFIDQNRDIFTHHNIEGHSSAEQRREAAKMTLAIRKFLKVDLVSKPQSLIYYVYAMGMFDGGICVKSLVSLFLYGKSLLTYGCNDKHSQLFKRAQTGQDIGCFCLTQFHHGSFSKGIQTIATYSHETQEFILSTQGTKGMKFWIGALSELANVCVIWAQLFINRKSEGPHPFYVQIRCPKTHKVLSGVTIGQCGPKKGLNYIDNGYILLDDMKIPRQNLLGRFGVVNERGEYFSPIKSRGLRFGLHMSALSTGRGFLAVTTNVTSLHSLVIALRYTHSRKQFQNKDNSDQIPIINYPLTKVRLIPHIAQHILQIPTGNQMALAYSNPNIDFSDQLYVNQLHAISSAVKARFTWNAHAATMQSRTLLGGHGYSALSRIPSIVDDIDVNVTWEGDNNMLLQQTSKYLVKVISNNTNTKIVDLTFVHQKPQINSETVEQQLRNINTVELLLQDYFRVRYFAATAKSRELSKTFDSKEQAEYNFHSQAGNALALAFADYYTFTIAKAKIAVAKDSGVRSFLQKCVFLWSFVLLERERYGSHDLRKVIQRQIPLLCEELVDGSVVATDALSASSFVIGSPFADWNGEGFKQYLNILYTKKGTFNRAHYYQDIIEVKIK